VEDRHVAAVVMAAEVCPGECIFIEADDDEERLTHAGAIAL
jgi:hypothetical protein